MKIGIIGGGTMGLTLAFRLGQAGHQATVFEAGPRVGGLATWHDYGDFTWDKFYHVLLSRDEHLRGLARDLGMEDKVRWGETKTGFLWNGRQLSMSNHWEFLTFPVLNLFEKGRLALGIIRATRIEDPTELERITSAEWLTRLFGKGVYRAIWEPLLESKYGVLKDEVPATIMWATIRRYYSTRSKSDGKERMGYISGGLKALYDGLLKNIGQTGGTVRVGAPVGSISEKRGGRAQVASAGERCEFDYVLSTTPTSVLERMAPELPELCGETRQRPKFLGIVCMAMVLKRALSPYYVTNLIEKGFPFTGVIGLSNLIPTEEFGGHHLAMLPRYDVPESGWFAKSDDEISREFLAALRPVWPDIDENVIRTFVNREKLVQALWVEAPPVLAGPPRSRGGKVWNVNAELAGRDTLNNNAIVRVADSAAQEFLSEIGAAGPRIAPEAAPANSYRAPLAVGE